ncbi:ATP-dependent DNA helicase 2 subunit 1 [Fusarium heterosporum]|uniref:ATP-dependent DNA helicase 2 subunit 1 n=1 Tax=Fusarium heterosporum TaxID=42747 RepID=A0A8H5TX67_FUSHE|nr:ATP-dependent DNA helicase 2 subunit 1 [Fusarium heterosporum]
MTDFLASFGLGAQSPAVSNNSQCDSVEELQIQMRSILNAKATPTRAEHVSITIELRATVRFQLAVLESENGALVNSSSPDPLLGGAQSAVMNGGQDGAQLSRVVFANDTLMNQPQDDPVLQRSVAKHIISMISSTDGSTWIVREVSRGTQGWSFTYLCRDSYQQWRRQNSKNPTKTVVGEFSQREPDPVLHTRPAFDCRGSIIIAFNRNSRSITVKYDHTPLHKTVAELAIHFKPPPRQLGPGAQRALEQQQQQKAKEKTPRKPRSEKRERKKRDSLKAQDENGNPRKRKKRNNRAAQATDGPMIPPDYPGASELDGQNNPSYTNGGQSADNIGQQGFSDYPEGLMGESVSATANLTASQTSQPGSATFPVNVSVAEAARRRDAATTMLSNAGVDPTTLSADQFGIFSNQAPELQRDSLNMLVKYGAERLRIVHPGNREGSAQESASTQSSQTTPTGPRTTKELVPQSSAQSNANTDAGASQNADDTSKSKRKIKKMGKSRTACFPCKARKTKVSITIEIVHCCHANTKKCPRERPTCTECSNHGTACEYAPQIPRNRGKKAKKSEAIVVEDNEEDEEEEEEGGEDELEEEQQEDIEEELDEEDREEGQDQQTTSQDYSYPQINNVNMATSTGTSTQDTHATQNNYYQPASGHVLPHPDPYSTNLQSLATAVSQRDNYSHTLPETQHIRHHPSPIPAPAGTIAPSETRRWTAFGSGSVAGGDASGSGSGKTRRSLPSEPPHQNGHNVPTTNPQPSDWAQSANTDIPVATVASVSPELPFNTRSSQRSRQKNQSLINDTAHKATSVANTVMQQAQTQAQARQSPVVAAAMMAQARKSPYQQVAIPRTTSRTSQRKQSRTPVADETRGQQPPPDMSQQHDPRSSALCDTSHMPSGSGYNSYGRYSNSNTATHHQQAMSAASATPTTMSTSYQTTSSTANQWSGSSNRNDRSYNSNPSYQTPNIYAQTAPPKPAPASRQNFNIRNSNTPQHTRGSSGSYNQQPQQSYLSYSGSEHQNQQGQTSNQQQQPGWYFQNSHNPSVHPGGQSSGYNYESWSGV